MRNPIARYATTIVSLLFCLLTGFGGGAYGFVWCLGDDGHSHAELAVDGSCESDQSGADHGIPFEFGANPSSQEKHFGPCLDVPLSFSAAQIRKAQADQAALQVLPLLSPRPPAFPSFFEALLLEHSFRPPPLPNQTLASLRTVVLLN